MGMIYNPGTNPRLTGRIAASVFCSLHGQRQKHNAACYPPTQTVIEQQNPLPLRSTLLFSRVFGQPGLVELDRLTHTSLFAPDMIKQGGLFRPGSRRNSFVFVDHSKAAEPAGMPKKKEAEAEQGDGFPGREVMPPSAGSEMRAGGSCCISASQWQRSQPYPLDMRVRRSSWRP